MARVNAGKESSKKKSKRAPRSRVDIEFSRPPMIAKIFVLGLGILTGVGVAAIVKPIFNQNEESEEYTITMSEAVPSPKGPPLPSPRKELNGAETVTAATPIAIENKVPAQPRKAVRLVSKPAVPLQAPTQAIKAPAARAVTYAVAIQPKAKPVPVAPPKPKVAVIAQTPMGPPTGVHTVASQTVVSQPSVAYFTPPPVPVKAVAVKKAEETHPAESSLSLQMVEDLPQTSPMPEKLKSLEKETAKDSEHSKDNVKIASRSPTEDSFKGRLKKAKKIQMADTEEVAEDTATSPFQDRLRKSVK